MDRIFQLSDLSWFISPKRVAPKREVPDRITPMPKDHISKGSILTLGGTAEVARGVRGNICYGNEECKKCDSDHQPQDCISSSHDRQVSNLGCKALLLRTGQFYVRLEAFQCLGHLVNGDAKGGNVDYHREVIQRVDCCGPKSEH